MKLFEPVKVRILVALYMLLVLCGIRPDDLFSQGVDFKVSDNGHAHFAPNIAADSAGNFVVVWTDGRNSTENGGSDSGGAIYAQRYAANGMPLGNNFRISEERPGGGQRIPSLGMRRNGDFVVAWHGPSGNGVWGDADIYARRFQRNGNPLGPSFKVSDDVGTSGRLDAKVSVRENGGFIITWADRREGPLFSYAQHYDSTGTAIGKNFRVNANGVEGIANISAFEDGRFFFMWSKYLQLYSGDAIAKGGIIDIGIDGLGTALGKDSILVLWYPFPEYKIYARFFNVEGLAISDSFRVDQDNALDNPIGKFSVAISNTGEFVVVWQDHRNDFPGVVGDGDIYAQRYDTQGKPIGVNFKVNHEMEERAQRDPAVVFSGDSFVTVWNENQTPELCPPPPPDVAVLGGITNIMGTIQSFENSIPGLVYGWTTKRSKCPPSSPSPSTFALHQNFPNPFNLETIIGVDLPEADFVDLSVYNLLGQRVAQLVHWELPAGRYQVPFSSAGFPSGVYIYRLITAKFVNARRMIMIR